MLKIEKESLYKLIDTLIKTSGDQNPLSKLTDVLKILLKTEDVKIIRSTLLLCLDTMSILNYNRQLNKFRFNKPTWFPSSEVNKFILLGALTREDIVSLDNLGIPRFQENNIVFKNIIFELPDSYYTEDIKLVDVSGFKKNNYPYFFDMPSENEIDMAIDNLISGKFDINNNDEIISISFVKDNVYGKEYIHSQDQVLIFDWISRTFIKTDIQNEIKDPEGVKLIKVIKKRGNIVNPYYESFMLLLEIKNGSWNFIYFDSDKIDERWARFVYLSKLEFFDLHKEIKNFKIEDKIKLFQNCNKIQIINNSYVEELDLFVPGNLNQTNEIIRIPESLLNQNIRYDKVNKILAVPVSLPLPQRILKTLYSCSGNLPYLYVNKFRINPRYFLKTLLSGTLVIGGEEIDYPYPNEPYFIDENLYLYKSVPPELAKLVFNTLKLDMSYEIFLQA